MIFLAAILGAIGLGTAAFVGLWFVRPDRFYRTRELVRHIRATELGASRDNNEPTAPREWKRVLVDARRRTGDVSFQEVLRRMYFLREQYYLNDVIGGDRLPDDIASPVWLGLVELCEMIEKLARQLRKQSHLVEYIVSADEILAFIARGVNQRAVAAAVAAKDDRALEELNREFAWLGAPGESDHVIVGLAKRQMSVEQATELLMAVAIALAMRVDPAK